VLAQAFEENATGGVFTVAVNHLKSKGSDCGGAPDDDPVQGNCNGTRTAAAEALVDWLAADPTGSGDLDALIMGDLNSYDKEDPIAANAATIFAC
jgi:predicted extracellular nuclease